MFVRARAHVCVCVCVCVCPRVCHSRGAGIDQQCPRVTLWARAGVGAGVGVGEGARLSESEVYGRWFSVVAYV